jgi:hypothetical protein
MVKWYKSQGLICVCFKRRDKDVCDPYEATPWRNHTWDTNYPKSLLNYILFNLSIRIIILSRGIQKEGWCLPKLKPPNSKTILKTKIPWTLYMIVVRIEKLRVFLLKCSWTSSAAVELSPVQLNFNFNCVFSCSWAFSTTVELQLCLQLQLRFFNYGWISTSTVPSAAVELFQLRLNFNFNCVFSCSWDFSTVVELQLQPCLQLQLSFFNCS